MLERDEPEHDQTDQSDVSQFARNSDQEFLELEQQTLFSAGFQGVQSILEQFRETPIAEVFNDLPDTLPEEPSITAAQLRVLVHRQLHCPLQQVKVEAKKTGELYALCREMAMEAFSPSDEISADEYEIFIPDEDITEEAAALARPIRETFFQLVPAALDVADKLVVEFTPAVKTDQQLIVYERRYLSKYCNPAESTRVLEIEEEQYIVFTRDVWGEWQQQGVLQFRTLSEYDNDPYVLHRTWWNAYEDRIEDLERQKERIVEEADNSFTHKELYDRGAQASDFHRRYHDLLQQSEDLDTQAQQYDTIPHSKATSLEAPHTSMVFDRGVHKSREAHVIDATQEWHVFAKLPETFNFPPPEYED